MPWIEARCGARACSRARAATDRSPPRAGGSRSATGRPIREPTAPRLANLERRARRAALADDEVVPGAEPRRKAPAPERLDKSPGRASRRGPPDAWVAYTDGACSGNPGPAGSGMVAHPPGGKIHEGFEYLGQATNNVAELTAILRARRVPSRRTRRAIVDPHRQPVRDRRPAEGVEGQGQPGARRAGRRASSPSAAGAARLRAGARRGADERARRRARARGDPGGEVEACRESRRPRAKVLPPPCRASSAPASSRATSPSSPAAGAASVSRSRATLVRARAQRSPSAGATPEKLDARARRARRSAAAHASRAATCDIRDVDQVARSSTRVEAALGAATVLVNNAGGQFPTAGRAPRRQGVGRRHPQQPERHLLRHARGRHAAHDPAAARAHRQHHRQHRAAASPGWCTPGPRAPASRT